MQEIVELVVFGLIAILVATGLLWLLGWLIWLIGTLFMWLAGVLWLVLRYIIPVVVILVAVYALFKLLQRQNKRRADPRRQPVVSGSSSSGAPRADGNDRNDNDYNNRVSSSATTAGTASGSAPAVAPVTTPAAVQGMPVDRSPEVKPPAADPDDSSVSASGEPVPDTVEVSAPEAERRTVSESAEPVEVAEVEVAEAEIVETGDASLRDDSDDGGDTDSSAQRDKR